MVTMTTTTDRVKKAQSSAPPFSLQWQDCFSLPHDAREQVLRQLRHRKSRNSLLQNPLQPPNSCSHCAAVARDVCTSFAHAASECAQQSEVTRGLHLNLMGLSSNGVDCFRDGGVVLQGDCMESMCSVSNRPKRQRSGKRDGLSLLGVLDEEKNGAALLPCDEVPRASAHSRTTMLQSAPTKCRSGRRQKRRGSASGDNCSPAVVTPSMNDPCSHGVFEMLKLNRRLDADFYKCDALELAPRLLGKLLRTEDVVLQITEVEAYRPNDSACHGRFGLTSRTAPVFGPGGHAYVYLCYGLHIMLNVVADREGVGAAVLIRSCAPVAGLSTIQQRRGQISAKPSLLTGPGKVGQALGLTTEWSHHPLYEPGGLEILDGPPPEKILVGPRVGIDYATSEDVAALWRFAIAGSAWISAPRNTLRAS